LLESYSAWRLVLISCLRAILSAGFGRNRSDLFWSGSLFWSAHFLPRRARERFGIAPRQMMALPGLLFCYSDPWRMAGCGLSAVFSSARIVVFRPVGATGQANPHGNIWPICIVCPALPLAKTHGRPVALSGTRLWGAGD